MRRMGDCDHQQFSVRVEVVRLEDTGKYAADVTINCVECGVPMVFLGLPRGLDPNGAATNVDGTELRAAIHPKGEVNPSVGAGFMVRCSQ